MQCFAASGQIAAGFAAFTVAEGTEMLLRSDSAFYPMFRTFLEACHTACDLEGAARLQAAVERFELISEVPVAMAIKHGSECRCENGIAGDGVGDVRKLWSN